jgi:hypothetical protein
MAGAQSPEKLALLFNERANAGDVEGLVALYEPDAVLALGEVIAKGHAEIRRFYTDLLTRRSVFPAAAVLPPILNGSLALTFASLNGSLSVEAARRQPDGRWLWVIDQLKVRLPKPVIGPAPT